MAKKKAIKKLIKKTIAISSGKGGVGKTTTAVNLALYYTKENFRVGLIDLDPLSDIITLLDLKEAEHIFSDSQFDSTKNDFEAYINKVFDNFHIIFPLSKLNRNDSAVLLDKLFSQFVKELDMNYDILIFDMPAGSRYEDNLIFLHYTHNLVLVTNAEPSAHVSAGGYIKNVLELEPKITIHLWHNKYNKNPGSGFNPRDVIGNYNKNVSDEVKLGKKITTKIKDLAFIPQDASLDLLQANPSPRINIQRSLLDLAEFSQEQRLNDLADIPPRIFELIKYFIIHTKKIKNINKYIDDLAKYLNNVLHNDLIVVNKNARKYLKPLDKVDMFTDKERQKLSAFLNKINEDEILNTTSRLIELLEKVIKAQEETFAMKPNLNLYRVIDKEIGKLLIIISDKKDSLSKMLVNAAGLILFYFSLYKLFQSDTIQKLVNDFIPKRKNKKGFLVRNRFQQIKDLVIKNEQYQKKYYNLIKTLYPIVNKQLSTVVNTFNLSNLLLREENRNVNKLAYLKLFTNFIHETVNSGLSIIIGFKRRPAAEAFKRAADELLQKIVIN